MKKFGYIVLILIVALGVVHGNVSASTKNVSVSSEGSWSAEYKVNYTSKKITSITNLSVDTTISTHSTEMKRISDKEIDIIIVRSWLVINSTIVIHNKLVNNKIVVTT